MAKRGPLGAAIAAKNLKCMGVTHLCFGVASYIMNWWRQGGAQGATYCKTLTLAPFVNIHDDMNCKRRECEQARANRLKHAENGNPPRKATGKKPKTKEQKKATRAKRTVKLVAQQAALMAAQEGKLTKEEAVKLGKIIRGRGDYTIGEQLGSKVGGWIGGKLQGLIQRIFGKGDYNIKVAGTDGNKSNSLLAGNSMPQFAGGASGDSVRVVFTEFFRGVDVPEELVITSIPIDITDPRVFPWASRMAPMFQQWSLNGCVIFFKSLSSEYAASQGMGSITLAFRYDVDSQPPTSIEEALNSLFATSDKPPRNQALAMERRNALLDPMKIPQAGENNFDKQFYQPAVLDILTIGPTAYTGAGQLYIAYDITFHKPITKLSYYNGGTFMVDLVGSPTYPLYPVADSPQVKQPRVNSLGLTLDADKTTVSWPLSQAIGSLYQVIYVCEGKATDNIDPLLVQGGGGMVEHDVLFDQDKPVVSYPPTNVNTGSIDTIYIGYWAYNGSGTPIDRPRLNFSLTGAVKFPDEPRKATLTILQVPAVMGSGLTVAIKPEYTREQFFSYLCDCMAGRVGKHAPPQRDVRVVDWVSEFKRVKSWSPHRKPRFNINVPDMTFVDAVAALAPYVEGGFHCDATRLIESKTTHGSFHVIQDDDYSQLPQNDFIEHRIDVKKTKAPPAVRTRLNGNNGSYTNTDDHDVDQPSIEFHTFVASDSVDTQLNVSELGDPLLTSASDLLTDAEVSESEADDVDQMTLNGSILVHSIYTANVLALGGFRIPIRVNPGGISVDGNVLREVYTMRKNDDWKYPELAPVKASCGWDVYIWPQYDNLPFQKKLRQLTRHGWDNVILAQAQCIAREGVWCEDISHHDQLPLSCFTPPLPKNVDQGDGKKAIGAIGAGSHKGDGPNGATCEAKQCDAPTHYHVRQRKRGPPVKPGAEQRIANQQRKLNSKHLMKCMVGNLPARLIDGACENEVPGKHWHVQGSKFDAWLDGSVSLGEVLPVTIEPHVEFNHDAAAWKVATIEQLQDFVDDEKKVDARVIDNICKKLCKSAGSLKVLEVVPGGGGDGERHFDSEVSRPMVVLHAGQKDREEVKHGEGEDVELPPEVVVPAGSVVPDGLNPFEIISDVHQALPELKIELHQEDTYPHVPFCVLLKDDDVDVSTWDFFGRCFGYDGATHPTIYEWKEDWGDLTPLLEEFNSQNVDYKVQEVKVNRPHVNAALHAEHMRVAAEKLNVADIDVCGASIHEHKNIVLNEVKEPSAPPCNPLWLAEYKAAETLPIRDFIEEVPRYFGPIMDDGPCGTMRTVYVYFTSDPRDLALMARFKVAAATYIPFVHVTDRVVTSEAPLDIISAKRTNTPVLRFGLTRERAVGNGPTMSNVAIDRQTTVHHIPKEFVSSVETPVFIELLHWLDDTENQLQRNLATGEVIMDKTGGVYKMQNTLRQRVMYAALNMPQHTRLKAISKTVFEMTVLYFAQSLMITATAIAGALPDIVKPVFRARGQHQSVPTSLPLAGSAQKFA